MSEEKFYLLLSPKESNKNLSICFSINNETFDRVIAEYNPSTIEWIDILRTRKRIVTEFSCTATSFSQCIKCPFFPHNCGTAFVYVRTFIHRKKGISFKVGVSNIISRPISQSSPFAILTSKILRRNALEIERILAKIFNNIYQSPSGRDDWASVISKGFWDGSEEAGALIDFIPHIYEKIEREYHKIYAQLENPILYIPSRHFSTELPQWISILPMRELRKYLTKEPLGIKGEVVSNRGALLLIEYGDSFWAFRIIERTIYNVNKILGLRQCNAHFRKIIMKLKN